MRFELALATTAVVTVVYIVFAGLLWGHAGSIRPQDPSPTGFLRRRGNHLRGPWWLCGREINRHAVDQVDDASKKARGATKERGEVAGKAQALADTAEGARNGGR